MVTSLENNKKQLKSVNITITGSVVEKSKTYKRPWTSVKEYSLIRDESEKIYDILGYKSDGDKKSVKEFNIIK